MSNSPVQKTPPQPPNHYLRPHLTAPHIPPDCPESPIVPVYCGELSGAISGDVYSYGYLTLGNQLVFLNMGGPRMAVEAIRARLSRGEMIHLSPDDAPAQEFTVTGMGKFEDYTENMSSHHFQNTILIHRNIAPNYNEVDTLTFALILAQFPKQVYSTFHQHLHQLLGVAVFPHWIPTLWATGLSAKFIEKCDGVGAVGYGVYLKATDWESIISIGVSTGALPLSETGDTPQTVTILDVAGMEHPSIEQSQPAPIAPVSPYSPIETILKLHLRHRQSLDEISTLARNLYPIITKHMTIGWEHNPDRRTEMYNEAFYYLYTNGKQDILNEELTNTVNALLECAKTLEVAPALLVYPPSMDTEGKRALYALLNDEAIVTQLHEDIIDSRKDSWRNNTFKERSMLRQIAQHITDDSLVDKVFWVVKTQGEY